MVYKLLLDMADYLNEVATNLITLHDRGKVEAVYSKLPNGLSDPLTFFENQYRREPARGFPIKETNALVEVFNSRCKSQRLDPPFLFHHVSAAYRIIGEQPPANLKSVFGVNGNE